MWHHFGVKGRERNPTLTATFKDYFSFHVQAANLV
jgi:hypothetical protein